MPRGVHLGSSLIDPTSRRLSHKEPNGSRVVKSLGYPVLSGFFSPFVFLFISASPALFYPSLASESSYLLLPSLFRHLARVVASLVLLLLLFCAFYYLHSIDYEASQDVSQTLG